MNHGNLLAKKCCIAFDNMKSYVFKQHMIYDVKLDMKPDLVRDPESGQIAMIRNGIFQGVICPLKYGLSRRTRLMRILNIHSMIYLCGVCSPAINISNFIFQIWCKWHSTDGDSITLQDKTASYHQLHFPASQHQKLFDPSFLPYIFAKFSYSGVDFNQCREPSAPSAKDLSD